MGGASSSVVLTFDDGPDPQGTPAMIEALSHLEMTATFFMLGSQAERAPGIVAEVAAAGHEIASHGYSHLPHAAMPPWIVHRDLDRARQRLEDLTGRRIRAVRAPFGAASLATMAHASRHGQRVVGWSRWAYDWLPNQRPATLASRLTRDIHAGDILLLHDSDRYSARQSWRATRDALAAMKDALDRHGLEATSLHNGGRNV